MRRLLLSAAVLMLTACGSQALPTPSPITLATPSPTSSPTLAPIPTPTVAITPEPTLQPTLAPTPTPRLVVVPPDGALENLICAYDWSPLSCGQIVNVAACESGRNTAGFLDGNWASNAGNYGLFQINGIHVADRFPDMFDLTEDGITPKWAVAQWNVEAALSLYQEQGLVPWLCGYAAYN